jgi:hypothetical protein
MRRSLVVALTMLVLVACGGEGGTNPDSPAPAAAPPPPPPPAVVASVSVSSRAPRACRWGATTTLTATPRDANNAALAGRTYHLEH